MVSAESRSILAQKTHISPQCLPLQTLLKQLQSVPPSLCWGPRLVAGNRNLCFSPFKKKKKSGFVSSRFHLSPPDKNPTVSHCWVLRGWLLLALVLCAWEPSLWSQLSPLKGETLTPILHPQPAARVNGVNLFHIPTLPTSLKVVFAPPVKSFFSR